MDGLSHNLVENDWYIDRDNIQWQLLALTHDIFHYNNITIVIILCLNNFIY